MMNGVVTITLLRYMTQVQNRGVSNTIQQASNTYCVGSCNTFAPPGLPCYGGTGKGVAPITIQLYPRALFMPTGLVAVAGQSKTTRTWNPPTGKWTFAGNLSVARSYGNMVLLTTQ